MILVLQYRVVFFINKILVFSKILWIKIKHVTLKNSIEKNKKF